MIETLTCIAECITALAGIGILWTISIAREQLAQDFEERFNVEYREILEKIPMEAFIDDSLPKNYFEDRKNLKPFFLYFDLSNEEIYHFKIPVKRTLLRKRAIKIRCETRDEWISGIKSNMKLPAFQKAWESLKGQHNPSLPPLFGELTAFIKEHKIMPN